MRNKRIRKRLTALMIMLIAGLAIGIIAMVSYGKRRKKSILNALFIIAVIGACFLGFKADAGAINSVPIGLGVDKAALLDSSKVATLKYNAFTYKYVDFDDAWEDAANHPDAVLTLYSDWMRDSALDIRSDHSGITIDLNGHVLGRNKIDHKNDGEVIWVAGGVTLNIKDSNPNRKPSDRGGAMPAGGVITGGSSGNGAGGIHIRENAVVNMTGGAIFGNETDEHGGGVYVRGGTFNMTNGLISYNKTNDSGDNCEGGGIYIKDSGKAILTNVLFYDNYSEDNGGAIYLSKGTVELEGCTFEKNYCRDEGGAIYLKSGMPLTAHNCTFKGNCAEDDGGAVIIYEKCPVEFTKTEFVDNFTKNKDKSGGAIWTKSNRVFLSDCTIKDNYSSQGYGGGVYIKNPGIFNLTGRCVVKDNKAKGVVSNITAAGKGNSQSDSAQIAAAGLTEGSSIGINSDNSNGSYAVVKQVSEADTKYFVADRKTIKYKNKVEKSEIYMATALRPFGYAMYLIIILELIGVGIVLAPALNKRKKRAVKTISMILALVMFAHPVLSEYHTKEVKADEIENGVNDVADQSGISGYVSDLRLYKGSKEDVEEKAKKEGYTLFTENSTPVDLNAYTGKKDVYLGYKVSDKESDAVRGLKMLEMDHGYEWFDYQTIAEGQMENIEPLAADIVIASKEFKKNLKNNSRVAAIAKDYLNYLYFTENSTSTKKYSLGDYLVSDSVDTQMIKKILIQANQGSVSAMYTYLSIAVSDMGDEKWTDRIDKAETFTKKNPSSSDTAIWDRMYYDYSLELLDVLRTFGTGYHNAEKRKKANDGEIVYADIGADDDGLTTENAQDVVDASDDEESGDLMYEMAYEMLNMYTVGEEKAGDYILSLADSSYEKRADFRKIYPLVDALTAGQYAIIKTIGLAQMALNLNQSDASYYELQKKKAEVEESIKKATGGKKQASIWAGVNTEFYEKTVALTSAAYRESKADSIYTDLTRQGEFYDDMNLAFMYVGLAGSVSMLITSCIYLGLVIAGSELSVFAACASIVGTGIFSSICGVLGCAAVVAGYVVLVVILVLAIMFLVNWLISIFREEDTGDSYRPEEIYDVEQVMKDGRKRNMFIRYEAVTNSDGKPADLNADEGKRWNILYFTKNESYGSPLTVNDMDQVFTRTVDSVSSPKGYEPVTGFGEKSAANLNAYVKKGSALPIYLHYITKDKIQGNIYKEDDAEEASDDSTLEDVNKGTVIKLENGEKYLYGLTVSSEDTESKAKLAITKMPGYKVYDKNLTPGDGFTYIGYSSTTVKRDAIKDIRVIPDYNGVEQVGFGEASYGCAGVLPNGTGIVFTRYASAGPPIIDTLITTDKLLGDESIYEPVNTFGGGEACNISSRKDSPTYLYFKPSVAYTSGDKYLAGVQFVASRQGSNTRDAKGLIKELGLDYYDVNFATYKVYPNTDKFTYSKIVDDPGYSPSRTEAKNGAQTGKRKVTYSAYLDYKDYEEYMCYTTTYNPYRAVYDIGIHTLTPRMRNMPVSFTTTEGNYAVCETTVVSSNPFFSGYNSEDSARNYKEVIKRVTTRAYIDPYSLYGHSACEARLYGEGKTLSQEFNLEGNVKPGYRYYRRQGLYMMGPVKDRTPLKVDDVIVSRSANTPAGMHSVQRFANASNSTPIDIGYIHDKMNSTPTYMYIRGTQKSRGRYISGIDVVTYKKPQDTEKHKYTADEIAMYDKMSDDTCIISLCSRIKGEVLNYNIAVDQNKAWYNNTEPGTTRSSYMGVTRTDDETVAITGLLWYKTEPDVLPPVRIKVSGIEYHRTGDKVGDYYLYYTKNPGANPGTPIEEITFDTIPMIDGSTTSACVSGGQKDGNASYVDHFEGYNGFIHLKASTDNAVVTDMKLYEGPYVDCVMNAMGEGFNYVVKESMNANTSGTPLYLAYKVCSADMLDIDLGLFDEASEEFDEEWFGDDDDWFFDNEDWFDFDIDFDDILPEDNVIRDVICLVGKPKVDSFEHGGATYTLLSDNSLNKGTAGRSIYMYYTYDSYGDGYFAPVSALALCSGNVVPVSENETNEGSGKWEMLLDDNGNEVNLNDSVIARQLVGKDISDGEYIKDSRLYLFLSRYEGAVKSGAEIKRGVADAKYNVVDIYLE